MQNAFDGNPVGIFYNSPGMTAYPNATWGALLRTRVTRRSYIMAGIYNGDPGIRGVRFHGADLSIRGPAFAMAEAGFQINGRRGDRGLLGNYKAGFWYDDSTQIRFGSAGVERGSWGYYGLFDQEVVPFRDQRRRRGLGIFGSVIVSADPTVAQLPLFFTAGVAVRGAFPSRSADSCGIGIAFGEFSGDLRHAFSPTCSTLSTRAAREDTATPLSSAAESASTSDPHAGSSYGQRNVVTGTRYGGNEKSISFDIG